MSMGDYHHANENNGQKEVEDARFGSPQPGSSRKSRQPQGTWKRVTSRVGKAL